MIGYLTFTVIAALSALIVPALVARYQQRQVQVKPVPIRRDEY